MGFNWKTYTEEYLSQIRNITPIEYYLDKIEKYIAKNYPGETIDTLKRVAQIRNMLFDFLPNSLPYKAKEIIDRYPEIPQADRHTVRFKIGDFMDFTTSLPEIAGRRITLSFTGATEEDRAVIEEFEGIINTPPYLIEVKPILRIDGSIAAEGTAMETAIHAGFTVEYTQPGAKTEIFDHTIITGSFNAIGITTGKVRPEYLSISEIEESEEVYMPKMLHSLVMKYHNASNRTSRILNHTMKIKSRTFIQEALVSTHQEREMLMDDIPLSFKLAGYKIDAKAMSSGIMPVDRYDKQKAMDFMMIAGYEASLSGKQSI